MRSSSDRITALRRMSHPDLAALLGRVPRLVELLDELDGTGGDGGARPSLVRLPPSLAHLGVLMGSPRGVAATVASLNQLERQLLALAALHDGAIERRDAVAEAGDHRALDQAADALAHLLLAHPPHEEGEWLVLRPGVLAHAPLPTTRIYDALQALPGHDLDILLERLGSDELPSRHEDRRRLVGRLLRRHEVVAVLRDRLDPDARRVLDVLVDHGPQRVADLGLPAFDPWNRRGGPLHDALQQGLIGVDTARQVAFAWLDVSYGLRRRLFDEWPLTPPPVTPAPVHDPGPRTPSVLRRLHTLLELWAIEPAPALSGGGLGVRSVRAAAKGLGLDEGVTGMLAHLAIDLGLLGGTDDGDWAPTPVLADLQARGPAHQWAAIVGSWLAADTFDEHDGLPNRWTGDTVWPSPEATRQAVLDVLLALEDGSGVDEGTLLALCAWRHPERLDERGATAVVAALRALDLVPPTGPVGLTGAARALLSGGGAGAAAHLGPVTADLVVQADHTVITGPGLDPRLAGTLAAMAELESDAGAQVWRITPRKVGEALADGRTRDELVTFLEESSRVPPPGNVIVTIDDVAARHGMLRSGAVGSYLRSEDPALLAAAADVAGAKLRVLAPTVAVSPLSREAMVKALRVRGVIAIAEDASGAQLPPRRTSGTPLGHARMPDFAVAAPVDPYEVAALLLAAETST